ncbi:MAG: type II toxin-antitoxin system VapC family toxin [Verrucomicrobiota bacterium]
MILDTCFLIDLHKEIRRRKPGISQSFLEEHRQTPFAISEITAIEFLEGFEDPKDGERFLSPFRRVSIDSVVTDQAATIRRSLRLSGSMIGDFDILIAASAMALALPIVTKDEDHFSRIPGLKIILY